MSAAGYKLACARPEVLPRAVLEKTGAVLRRHALRESILVRTQLWSRAVEKPPLHKGDAESDRLILSLSEDEIRDVHLALLAQMLRCEVEGEAYLHERYYLHSLHAYWETLWFAVGAP